MAQQLKKVMGCLNVLILLAVQTFAGATLSNGYVLCGAYGAKKTVLLDKTASIVKVWEHTTPNGYSVYLLENGNLLRTAQVGDEVKVPDGAGPKQGLIEEVDPLGNVVWSFQLADEIHCTHHDMKPIPNGNIIAVSFELLTKEQMVEFGLDTALLAGGGFGSSAKACLAEMIFEVKPDKSGAGNNEIIWEWHIKNHLVPEAQAGQHPELFNGSMGQLMSNQWVHLNGLDYCPRRDLIVFTSRVLCEVYIIDHSTTTEEAAGHTGGNHGKGGDILYRWGKPSNFIIDYEFDTTISRRTGDTIITQVVKPHPNDWINVLHCCTFIPEGYPGDGNIMFFHNNSDFMSTEVAVSQVIELTPPTDANGHFISAPATPFGPEQPTWMYAPADSFHSPYMSSALRMHNGNTLVHEAGPTYGGGMSMGMGTSTNSRLREVTPSGEMIWSAYIDLSGIQDTSDTSGAMAFNPPKIMYYPEDYIGITNLFNVNTRKPISASSTSSQQLSPSIRLKADNICFDNVKDFHLSLFTLNGKQLILQRSSSDKAKIKISGLPAGTYMVSACNGASKTSRMITILQ